MEPKFNKCLKCGTPKSGGTDCPSCGVIYAKAEKVYLTKLVEAQKEKAEAAFAEKKLQKEAALFEEKKKAAKAARAEEAIGAGEQKRKEDAAGAEKSEKREDAQAEKETKQQKLVTCAACEREISINAPACPHCGEPQNIAGNESANSTNFNSKDNTMLIKQAIGVGGSILLFIGVFMPIVSIPVVGSMNYFRNGKGDGMIVLILAVIACLAALSKHFKVVKYAGIGSVAVILFTFFHFQYKMSEVKNDMEADLSGNPFRGLADMAMESIQLQWGWAVLSVGALMLIASAAIKSED